MNELNIGVVMKILKIVIIILASVFLAGCNGIGVRGSGIVKDETRDIFEFDALEVGGFYHVTVECGKEPALQITGDDNIIPLIRTEIRGGTLHIWSHKSISPRKKLRIRITTRDLNSIITSGASNISVKNLDNEELSVEASGAGSLRLSGKTDRVSLELSGAVNLNASDLQANQVDVEISGASNADVYASEALKAEISGVGNIDYYGSPKNIKKRISGLGSITQR